MCFICQNTSQIFVKSPELSNNLKPCPICNNLGLYELNRIIHHHKRNGTSIKSIRMTQRLLNEITSSMNIYKNDDIKVKYPNNILMGIVVIIDDNIHKWEIEYEK